MSSQNQSITLEIEGMTCSHCAQTVEKTLKNAAGDNVLVDFLNKEATVKFAKEITTNELIEAVRKAGYKAKKKKSEISGAHEHHHGYSSVEKKFYLSLLFTVPLFSHMFLPHNSVLNNPFMQLALCMPVMIIGWLYFGKSAWGSLRSFSPNMDVLITLGSSAAFFYSLAGTILFLGTEEMHNYLFFETAATIITLVLLGNVMEERSIKKTTSAIHELSKLQATTAKKIIYANGQELITEIQCSEIQKGDLFMVNSGDKIPIDGEIVSGQGLIDEAMITGESIPVNKFQSDKVIGGTILSDGNFRIKATAVGGETVLAKIIEMVKTAQKDKPKIQRLGDKVSAVFVPVVVFISLVTFFSAYYFFDMPAQKSLMNAVAVLVISCPCAMGLATPTAVMVGLGRAAKNGILIKGASTVEEFSKIKNLVFDKTGTLTTGNFKIKKIGILNNSDMQYLKDSIFTLEKHSSHPIAKSLVKELQHSASEQKFTAVTEIKGIGISANDEDGNLIKIGSYKMLQENSLVPEKEYENANVFILKNKLPVGFIEIEDEIKENAKEVISHFNSMGITSVLLSGDKKEKCELLAQKIGISEVYSEQLPAQKMKIITDMVEKDSTAMFGDGINDAPSLTKATVGISMSNATQIAINAAQIILLDTKDLSKLSSAFQISKHTLKTIKQNLFWAFFYNILAIPLAAFGLLSPMVAALTMAFSDVVVIGNSLRLRIKTL